MSVSRILEFTVAVISLLSLACCVQEKSPVDARAAQSQLAADAIIRSLFGGISLGSPNIVFAQNRCEGAAGSLVEPMLLKECEKSNMTRLLRPMMGRVNRALDLQKYKTVKLNGLSAYFTHQKDFNLCWAAATTTIMNYNGFNEINQEYILSRSAKICPRIQNQYTGADLFQVSYVIGDIDERHGSVLLGKLCDSYKCIIDEILNDHPFIVFMDNHAVVLGGVSYFETDQGPLVDKFYALDPAGTSSEFEEVDASSLCRMDAALMIGR